MFTDLCLCTSYVWMPFKRHPTAKPKVTLNQKCLCAWLPTSSFFFQGEVTLTVATGFLRVNRHGLNISFFWSEPVTTYSFVEETGEWGQSNLGMRKAYRWNVQGNQDTCVQGEILSRLWEMRHERYTRAETVQIGKTNQTQDFLSDMDTWVFCCLVREMAQPFGWTTGDCVHPLRAKT